MNQPPAAPNGLLRLSKLMADRGLCSRREADELIGKGWVLVNGLVVDLDLGRCIRDRMQTNSFNDCRRDGEFRREYRRIPFEFEARTRTPILIRHIEAHPFVPADPKTLKDRRWHGTGAMSGNQESSCRTAIEMSSGWLK